jgi:signal transduction histidine kinase
MATEVILAEEKLRKQFATELHDSVIQTLGAVKIRTQLLNEHVKKKGADEYTEIQNLLSQAIRESRQIMAELSPPVLSELGFVPAIEWLTEQFSSQNGLDVKFKYINGIDSNDLVHDMQVLLFQATRELLMNVVKHANSKKAMVVITDKKDTVRVTVKDDGVGFQGKVAFREDKGGFGLFSVRERLKHLGGQLIIESKPNRGTRVTMISPRSILQQF